MYLTVNAMMSTVSMYKESTSHKPIGILYGMVMGLHVGDGRSCSLCKGISGAKSST